MYNISYYIVSQNLLYHSLLLDIEVVSNFRVVYYNLEINSTTTFIIFLYPVPPIFLAFWYISQHKNGLFPELNYNSIYIQNINMIFVSYIYYICKLYIFEKFLYKYIQYINIYILFIFHNYNF